MKRIAIVSHATAISYLLKKWCDIQIVDDKLRYSFNNNIILNGYFNYCETFKLEFDDKNKIISIENIKLKKKKMFNLCIICNIFNKSNKIYVILKVGDLIWNK